MIIADRVIDIIYLKYLKAAITYEKDTRIETYPYPREAIREAVFNALIHCNYADSTPIQIRIEDKVMYISNCCILPSNWTTETLLETHKSRPYNPDIANTFFRAEYVETWGRGIQKICESCNRHGIPEPEYKVLGGDITVKFTALKTSKVLKRQSGALGGGLDGTLEDKILSIIKINPQITQKNIAEETDNALRTVQRKLKELQERGVIERKGGKRYGYWEIHQ